MTSNIGSQWMQDLSLGEEERQKRTMESLRATFRPEFLNRIDDIITFRALSIEDIRGIIGIQIGLVQKRLQDRKINLELTDRVREYISEEGYSPVYGARPLKRALQRIIEDSLATRILEGEIAEGDDIVADLNGNGEIVFRKK
jgi:ATP-dependent Clp protease ATP-binding subunit ClpB